MKNEGSRSLVGRQGKNLELRGKERRSSQGNPRLRGRSFPFFFFSPCTFLAVSLLPRYTIRLLPRIHPSRVSIVILSTYDASCGRFICTVPLWVEHPRTGVVHMRRLRETLTLVFVVCLCGPLFRASVRS